MDVAKKLGYMSPRYTMQKKSIVLVFLSKQWYQNRNQNDLRDTKDPQALRKDCHLFLGRDKIKERLGKNSSSWRRRRRNSNRRWWWCLLKRLLCYFFAGGVTRRTATSSGHVSRDGWGGMRWVGGRLYASLSLSLSLFHSIMWYESHETCKNEHKAMEE